ncbi:MAG: beta-lactamase family protein [Chitinophagaceae bacterium]|nr:beta-lactamase family protein [Anaerolineae bacterium]
MKRISRWVVLGLMLALLVPLFSTQAQSDLDEVLQEVLESVFDSTGPAAVLQITTPEGTWSATTGRIDTQADTPPTLESRFRIGSISKTFVAVVALQLVEEGVITLDDPINMWLPDELVENVANAEIATIRQLLSMRSGIPEYLEQEFLEAVLDDPQHVWTAPEALTYAYDKEAYFEPDTAFLYTNTNYVLMQLVLEAAAGEPLNVLVRERILDPLALENTYTQIQEDLPDGIVHGYADVDGSGELVDVRDYNDGAGLGDGALVSTTGDLSRFYQALLQDRTLLSEESMLALLDFQDTGEGDGYSLGLNNYQTPWGTALGHPGGVLGFSSIALYLPDQEIIVVGLFATDATDLLGIVTNTLTAVLGEA